MTKDDWNSLGGPAVRQCRRKPTRQSLCALVVSANKVFQTGQMKRWSVILASNWQYLKAENRKILWKKAPLPSFSGRAVVAEWLRRLTRNQLGSARTGSNPVHCGIVQTLFEHFFTILAFLHAIWKLLACQHSSSGSSWQGKLLKRGEHCRWQLVQDFHIEHHQPFFFSVGRMAL